MKRHLCISAFFALVLIPDWSAACGPRGGMPAYAYEGAYHAPVYYAPVYYAQPVYPPMYVQPVYVQPYAPMTPPRVEQSKPKTGSMITEQPRPIAGSPPVPAAPPKPPETEVRPAAGVDIPSVQPAKPEPAPASPPTPAPTPEPKRGGLFEIPKNPTPEKSPVEAPKLEPKLPDLELPKNDAPKLPSLELPKTSDPKLPSLDLPKTPNAEPKLPSLDPAGGNAVPSPAPAPDSLIPPPNIPSPKNDLPPLTLPPDTPVSPSPAPPSNITEVKSSPLGATRELKVSVFPASGTATATGLRKVGFYNHTGRDLSLMIEGRAVTLPAMTYLHAQLPPTFTWKCADKATAKATVPADATGLDVLIRE
jgi:hypothetical protein